MKFRKVTALLLVLCMMLSLSISAFAASDTIASGTIPDSKIKWELDSHGWLTISGSGEAPVFQSADDQPWGEYREQITEVWYDDMSTLTISDLAYWFEGCTALTTAELPLAPVIGTHAFYGCSKLNTITMYYGETVLKSIGEDAFWRETDSGDTLYIAYIIGYPESTVPFYTYDWAASNRSNRYFYDLYGVYSNADGAASTVADSGIMKASAKAVSRASTGIVGTCPSCKQYSLQGTYVSTTHTSRGHAEYYEYADHTDANGDGKCDDCGATVSLTIKWDAGTNGGTIDGKASFSETMKPNSKPTAPSASPVKTGHTFKNWYTEKTGGKLYNTVTSITTSQTFYAQFTANTYTVTWSLGDGRSETTEQTYGEKLVLPTDPERKNAEFLGWFTEKDGGTEVTANTVFKETAATTYYAHWEITELFSVTVPATLPLVVDEAGKVYVASASIVNNSTGDVMVSSVSVTSKNGWEFVPYSTNMAKAKVDAKQVGFKINSSETSKTGDSEVFTLAAPWTVKEADALSINYDAVVSAVSQPVTGQEIMSVVFVLEWA